VEKEKLILHSLEVIENRICEKLNTDMIAHSIFLSKYHYQRLFQSIVGASVIGYVKERKLSMAARDLLDTNSAVLDIALKYGYSSHESFTRAFKSYMGVTPSDCRKYNISIIKKDKFVKEASIMPNAARYSKNTEEILGGLNDFIVLTRQTAEFTRKKIR
jgi:AraC-like DNA-binding protein